MDRDEKNAGYSLGIIVRLVRYSEDFVYASRKRRMVDEVYVGCK